MAEFQAKLDRAASELNAKASFVSEKLENDGSCTLSMLVRKNDDEKADFIDVRVACVGNVDGEYKQSLLSQSITLDKKLVVN